MNEKIAIKWPVVGFAALLLGAGFAVGWYAGRDRLTRENQHQYESLLKNLDL